LTLAATVVLGRFFCGWVCPFGTLHHLVGQLGAGFAGARRRLIARGRYAPWQALKYYLLVSLLLIALFTPLQPAVLDPLCIMARSCTLSVFPAFHFLVKGALSLAADSDLPLLDPAAETGYAFLESRQLIGAPVFFRSALLTGFILASLLVANLWYPRFWCRFLCPLGALLGLVSRVSLLRMGKRNAQCTMCGDCTIRCQGGSSPEGGARWKAPECLLCLNCLAACPEDVLDFSVLGVRDAAEYTPDLTRRGLIVSIGAGLLAIPLLRASGRAGNRSMLIRPPGARPEDEFLRTCLRCGTCTRICPTSAIHPSIAEAGIEGLWTPRLIPRIGYCVYSCTLCGQVCPSQAIRKLNAEQKMGSERLRPVKLGTAAVDRKRCIPWATNMSCIACEEVCPVSPKAIKIDEAGVRGPRGEQFILGRPVVDALACIGCGHCEYVCPVEGAAAIRVYSAGETRAG
jgi:ferredoxin